MNDTPRSDEALLVGSNTLNQGNYVHLDFARQLERELNVSKYELEQLKKRVEFVCVLTPTKARV